MRMYVKNVALFCGAIIVAVSACAILMAATEVHYVSFDRHNLPDLGPFTRFEFSTVGRIYDASDGARHVHIAPCPGVSRISACGHGQDRHDESRRPSESASTTAVHWDREQPAAGCRCRSFRN